MDPGGLPEDECPRHDGQAMHFQTQSWAPQLFTCQEGDVMDDEMLYRQSHSTRSLVPRQHISAPVGQLRHATHLQEGSLQEQSRWHVPSQHFVIEFRASSLPAGACQDNGGYREHGDNTQQSQHSFVCAQSTGSRCSPGSAAPTRNDVDPEDWSEAPETGSSHVGDIPSELEDEDEELLHLLKHSLPVKVGPGRHFHMVRIVRAHPSQTFGLKFGASQYSDGRPNIVVSAKDYPYLSVKRHDRLVSVNGAQLRQATDVTEVLQKELSLTLVFQRRGTPSHEPQPWVKDCRVPMAEVNRSLVTATRAKIVNRERGEFKLSLHRTSLEQNFGLPCEDVLSNSESPELSFIISKDLPHLAVMGNDRLCVINGVEPCSRSEYTRLKNSSLSLSLVFRRDPSQLHDFVHHIQDFSEDVSEVDHQQRRTCGPCNMLGPDVAVHKSDSMGGAKNMKSPKALSWFLGHFTGSSGFSRVWPCKPPDSEVKEVASESSNIEELFSIFEGTQQKGATKTVQRAPKTAQSSRRNGKAVQVDSPNLLGMQVDSPNLLGMSEPGGWQL